MMKRVFGRLSADKTADFALPDTPAIAFDLEWFLARYPLDMEQADMEYLAEQAAVYSAAQAKCSRIFEDDYTPPEFDLVIPVSH